MSPLLSINKGVAIAWTYLLPVILKGHGTGRLHLPQDLNRRAPFDLAQPDKGIRPNILALDPVRLPDTLLRHRLEHFRGRRPARITFHILDPPLEFGFRDRRELLILRRLILGDS